MTNTYDKHMVYFVRVKLVIVLNPLVALRRRAIRIKTKYY